MANYKSAVRESILAKIAVYLAANSRDVVGRYKTLPRFETRLFVTHGIVNLKFAIVPRLKNQDYYEPGVNVIFLDEISQSPGRLSNKRWLLPVIVRITKPIAAGEDPFALSTEVSNLMEKVIDCISDHFITIYDFRDNDVVIGTGSIDKDRDLIPEDESAPMDGGDIRLALTFYVSYVDKAR